MASQEPMVKRTLLVLVTGLAAAAGWGAGARESMDLVPSAMDFPGIRPAPYATLLARGELLTVVYADRDTTSLRALDVPAGGDLPRTAPRDTFVDKVDIVPPLGGSFGLHAAAAVDGHLRLLYLDRERDDRPLLKLVTEEAAGWRLQLIEPLGAPLAILAGADGTPMDAWAPGSLRLRGASGEQVLREPFAPLGQAFPLAAANSVLGTGFGCWDDASGELLVVRSDPDGVQSFPVPGAGPISAIAEAPDGTVAVATWDAAGRRILLLEHDGAGRPLRRTTVTVCDGTTGVFLAWTPSGWLFVYDEVRPVPVGRWMRELAVLSPEPRTVGRPRYRRGLLTSGNQPIAGFRALITRGSLFVLEMGDGLRLLKIPVP
jgi:hypothetical protein